MLIKSYIATQPIQITHSNDIPQYTRMIIVEVSLYKVILSHNNEKVTKSYKFNYEII